MNGVTQNIIISREEIENSPSYRDGIDSEKEFQYRCFGCELIREASILMELTPVVCASGQTLFHRFYYFNSFKKYHPFFVSMVCLLVGSKIEEELRPVSKTIKVFYRMFQRRTGEDITILSDTDPACSIFIRWRSILIDSEKLLLSLFGYHLYGITDHPHRYILFFIKKLNCDSVMAQRSWNILNDSLQLPLCVQYTANTVACAAIYLAAMTLNIQLPQNVAWWELFDASFEDIQAIIECIVKLYKRQRIDWLPDIEAPPAGIICLFNTLSDSVIVSPIVEMINQKEVTRLPLRCSHFGPVLSQPIENNQQKHKDISDDRKRSSSSHHSFSHRRHSRSRSHSHHRSHHRSHHSSYRH